MSKRVISLSLIALIITIGGLAYFYNLSGFGDTVNYYLFVHDFTRTSEFNRLYTSIVPHNNNVPLYVAEPDLYGLSLGQWTVKWWQWASSYKEYKNQTSGEIMDAQNEPFYFLMNRYDKPVTRNLTIPAWKGIMFPIYNIEAFTYGEAKPSTKETVELMLSVDKAMDNIYALEAELDGSPLQYYRVKSPLFGQLLVKDNVFHLQLNDNPVNNLFAVADGYYVFIESLSIGNHVIHIRAEGYDYQTEVTYYVNVIEEKG